MSTSAAAIWSAIAATFSAIAAFTMMRIQHRNMLDSTRPEIILSGWDRKIKQIGDHKYEIVTFNKLRNIGKGSALHIYINSSKTIDDKPLFTMSTKSLSILPANEEHEINGEITLFWDNAALIRNDHKYLPIEIEIYSWCSKDYRHKTIYSLMAFEPSQSHMVETSSEIAPGVMLTTRRTVSKPVWRLKLLRQLSRLPGIGEYVPKDR